MIFKAGDEDDGKLIRYDNPENLSEATPELLNSLRLLDQDGLLSFHIPMKFKTNVEKSIYKSGFLVAFLKGIYPKKPMSEICEIINVRYQLFLGKRQIERNVLKFNTNRRKFKN